VLLLHQGVVLGDGNRLAAAHMIATGISHMRDDGLVMAQGTGNDSGGHALSSPSRVQPFIVYSGIRELDKTRQEADERGPRRSESKLVEHDGDCFRARDIAEVQAADAVGDNKHPSMRLCFLPGLGDECPHGVFIVWAKLARITGLPKDYAQHNGLPHGTIRQTDRSADVAEMAASRREKQVDLWNISGTI
jgi:hypothetical protein